MFDINFNLKDISVKPNNILSFDKMLSLSWYILIIFIFICFSFNAFYI
ncbi:conserved hypothetical protein [Borreliella burgdorferi 29805]|uniref:Uncharacterized protein n=1 Tax=Borreliella burgdorferi (strain ZS7) TaxID=445985 RepID=A0A0H3C1H0_BORBZ|nr:conserved hypothetical protein [Borreliella burgdorferi ZS7]EEC22185.1 conserved hypothetical protein [Borreliella burgdorferi 156a]EEF56259.1 conserved hypothetical protein [Borreliella burgdorferi 64b]EEH31996.1 conserved hypothetical protein [Borreliella burgdorferi Bol26]EEH32583.1 conserved hypothetical protein [Borreliella burgdorferi 29805]